MRTEQLYYFLEAVSCGSFSKAAENLYIKQPSLREGINNLERELGAKLFFTTNKGVMLTQYGQACLPTFTRIIQLYENIKLQNHPNSDISLKIGLDLFVNNIRSKASFIQNSLYESQLLSPTLQYTICQNLAELFAKLFAKELDTICFLMPNNINTFSASLNAQIEHDTIQHVIFPVEIFAVFSKNHPIVNIKNPMLSDFSSFLLLIDDTLQYTLQQYTRQQGYDLNLQIVNSKTQSNLLFFRNAICFNHNYSLEKAINFDSKPNIRKISLSHLFNFHVVLYYLRTSEKQEQIKSYINMLKVFENYCSE